MAPLTRAGAMRCRSALSAAALVLIIAGCAEPGCAKVFRFDPSRWLDGGALRLQRPARPVSDAPPDVRRSAPLRPAPRAHANSPLCDGGAHGAYGGTCACSSLAPETVAVSAAGARGIRRAAHDGEEAEDQVT